MLNLHRDLEVIFDHLLQRRRGARLHRHQRYVVQQCFILDLLAVAQSLGTQPDQVEKVVREEIARAGGVGDGKAGSLPGAIEERDGAMIENIEEGGQPVVLGAEPLQDQLAVGVGKHTRRTGEPHEVHHHLRRSILGEFQLLDLAGRKTQPRD